MDQSGDTYEKYYTPTHIARDFQSIYFGTPSEEELVRAVAGMGLSRDRRAPTALTDDQQEQVRNDAVLVALREDREECKEELRSQGHWPLVKAQGTKLYEKYSEITKDIGSTYQSLRRTKLAGVIKAFHDSIDTIEIARQLNGKAAEEVLTLPSIEFELRVRASIAGMLFKPVKDDKSRVQFIRSLASLCKQQEARQSQIKKRKEVKEVEFVVSKSHEAPPARKRRKTAASEEAECESGGPGRQEIPATASQHAFPMVLPHPVCLICIGNEEFSYERRMKPRPRRDVLKKHVETHFRKSEYQGGFECRHPSCSKVLDGMMHFKRHALDHGVCH